MAHICEVCGKGIMSGNNVSHSNRHTHGNPMYRLYGLSLTAK